MTLDEKIDTYAELKAQSEAITQELETLKGQIIEDLEKVGVNEYTSTGFNVAKLVSKTTIKYSDELAMIGYCKKNGLGYLISERLNTSEFNKKLKASNVLTESLHPYYEEVSSLSLTVKKA